MAAAVSGGADSVALLCLLLELRDELGIVLSVAHVNHKLRGEESDEDERFVAELARRHELQLYSCNAPIEGTRGSGIEAAARELRYEFFRRLVCERHISKIATAHTLDDQAETVLLRIFRGTGIRGLSGIHPRIIFEDQGRALGEVVRPLLSFRRNALLEFLRQHSQIWREDSSNVDISFLRNRVRHRLLPMITAEFGEASIEHLSELAEIARVEEAHWRCGHPEIAAALKGERSQDDLQLAVPLPVRTLQALPLAARRRLVRAWFETNAPDVSLSFRLIEQALELADGPAGKKMELSSKWNLRRRRDELRLELATSNQSDDDADYEYALQIPGVVDVPELGARIEARVVDPSNVPEEDRGKLLNADLVPGQIVIRNWRAGDRFWPAHSAAERKVKELLSERHATGVQKKLWPVAVADGCGLIWVRGFAVPAALRATAGASRAIQIRVMS